MSAENPIGNKITLWQSFNALDGQTDMIVIYEPTHLKILMRLSSSDQDSVALQLERQEVNVVTQESGFKMNCGNNRTSCWSEETKRALWIPYPTNPKLAHWEEKDDVLTVTVPWVL